MICLNLENKRHLYKDYVVFLITPYQAIFLPVELTELTSQFHVWFLWTTFSLPLLTSHTWQKWLTECSGSSLYKITYCLYSLWWTSLWDEWSRLVCTITSVLFLLLFSVVEYNPKYERIVAKLQEAVDYGVSGERCDARYTCSSKS